MEIYGRRIERRDRHVGDDRQSPLAGKRLPRFAYSGSSTGGGSFGGAIGSGVTGTCGNRAATGSVDAGAATTTGAATTIIGGATAGVVQPIMTAVNVNVNVTQALPAATGNDIRAMSALGCRWGAFLVMR